MGFTIAFALDNWKPAIETHQLNHPDAQHRLMDILEIESTEDIDSIIPDTEIIIGSPPCVAFSGSNRAGKADKTLGLQLIERMLRIVAWKMNKPNSILKYWIMENVPNSQHFIKDSYTFEELDLSGGKKIALRLEKKAVLCASDYGAPQSRKRFICGNYVSPQKTFQGKEVFTQKVLESLSDPLAVKKPSKIKDPNYKCTLEAAELTDHFYDTTVAEWEWKKSKRMKQDHGFMGKMDFPENRYRTSRTVMATRSASTREAMLFGGKKDDQGNYISYRLPTIREVASLMSFPIDYQFEAGNESSKYRLVGNAVCPLQAKALAKAIADSENLDFLNKSPRLRLNRPSFDLTGYIRPKKVERKRKSDAKYARHVPYLKVNGFRAELVNHIGDLNKREIEWKSVLHQGSGKNATSCLCDAGKIRELLASHSEEVSLIIETLDTDIEDILKEKLPDAFSLQKIFTFQESGRYNPDSLLSDVRELLDLHFPEESYSNAMINNGGKIDVPREKIPLRILSAFYILNRAVEFVNTPVEDV